MEYEVLASESPEYWLIRVFGGDNELCGKLRLDTATKDALVAKFVELGWTERT
jgi:hypothetical protein